MPRRLANAWFALIWLTVGSAAAEPRWPTGLYNYVVVDQDLRDVMQEFGINTGIRVALSEKVQGRVHGPLPVVPPKQFLNNLAQQYGLEWIYDGSVISISAASEADTEMVVLRDVPFGKLRDGLSRAGLLDSRYQFRPAMNGRAALVSGPPRFLSLVHAGLTAALAEMKLPAAADVRLPARVVTVMRGASTTTVELKAPTFP